MNCGAIPSACDDRWRIWAFSRVEPPPNRSASCPAFGRLFQPRRATAASREFLSRHAIVIGPTPPGTGVRARDIEASAKATSPIRRVCPAPSVMRLMPTSITIAPGFTHSPRTTPACRGGDDDIGAARRAGRSRSRMCHRHRAFFPEQQLPHRLADDVRFSDDDGFSPESRR